MRENGNIMKRSKRYTSTREKCDRQKKYPLAEAVQVIKGLKSAKFNESLEVAIRLGVNPKHADQMVRGTVALPHGTGKKSQDSGICSGGEGGRSNSGRRGECRC